MTLLSIGLVALLAAEPKPVIKNQGFLPFADAPIHYRTSKNLADQITVLNRQLEAGKAKLTYEPKNGYLRSVLELLGIPASSQTLVHSKTSLQFQHIDKKSPRALYFNDNVYVGQVLGAKSLELIAFDAQQGAVFYVLGEQEVDEPRFERAQLDCMQCHIAQATRRIPGVMVRSSAKPGAPVHTMGHETPFENRFGGWYVTGLPGFEPQIDLSRYLTNTSDVVAHLVLAHQTQMHNLITETNYRFRLGQDYHPAADATVDYLLFANEATLPEGIQASSDYQQQFVAMGPKDSKGRSLREFDLKTRLFRYPLSYLIYSDAFDALPEEPRRYILKKLYQALVATGKQDIIEILAETKPGLNWE